MSQYSTDSISESSEGPSFYSDPFKSPKLQIPQGYSPQSSSTPQKAGSPASARPYPVSMRAYNQKDYKYITNFPRSLPAGLRATRSDAELLNKKTSSCTDTESDPSSSASSTAYLKSSGSSDGSSVESISKERMCLMQEKCQQYLEEKLISGDAKGRQWAQEQRELGRVMEGETSLSDHIVRSDVEGETSLSDHIVRSDLGDCPCRGQWEGEFDERSGEQNQHVGGPRNMPLDEVPSPMSTLLSNVPSLAKPQHPPAKQSSTPPAAFGSWDVQNRESYTAIFDNLRTEKKKARGLQSQVPPISLSESNKGLPHSLKNAGSQHASPRRRWFSRFS